VKWATGFVIPHFFFQLGRLEILQSSFGVFWGHNQNCGTEMLQRIGRETLQHLPRDEPGREDVFGGGRRNFLLESF